MNKINETSWTKNKPMHSLYAEQNDWNQTLMTKINQCGAQLFQERIKTENTGEVSRKLIVPTSFKEAFETLMYYDAEKKVHAGKYAVEFADQDDIYVIENENYCSIKLVS